MKETFYQTYPNLRDCFDIMTLEELNTAIILTQEEIKKRKQTRYEEAVARLVEELNHFKKEFPFAELNIDCYCNCGDSFPINVLEYFNTFEAKDFSMD